MAVNGGHARTKKGPNWGHVRIFISEDFAHSAKRDPPFFFGGGGGPFLLQGETGKEWGWGKKGGKKAGKKEGRK